MALPPLKPREQPLSLFLLVPEVVGGGVSVEFVQLEREREVWVYILVLVYEMST